MTGDAARVTSELGAVVEGDGLTQLCGKRLKQSDEMTRDAVSCRFARLLRRATGGSCARARSGRLGRIWEQHEIGLPMAGRPAIATSAGRSAMETRPLMKLAGTPPFLPRSRACTWRGASSGATIVLGASDLGVDEAIDALMADRPCGLVCARAGRRSVPATSRGSGDPARAAQHGHRVPGESPSSAGRRLLMRIARLVADLRPHCVSSRERLLDGERSRAAAICRTEYPSARSRQSCSALPG